MDLDTLITLADRLGGGVAVLLGVLLIAALYTKRLVFGWLYAECATGRITCEQQVSERAARIEAELNEMRKERLRHDRA